MQALEKETQTSVEVNFSPLQRRYTLEEFWALPEREDHARYNLIGGLVRNPGKVGDRPVWEGWRYSRGDLAKSVVLAGWEVSVDEIFRGIEFLG
jgi:hypothetical protein